MYSEAKERLEEILANCDNLEPFYWLFDRVLNKMEGDVLNYNLSKGEERILAYRLEQVNGAKKFAQTLNLEMERIRKASIERSVS